MGAPYIYDISSLRVERTSLQKLSVIYARILTKIGKCGQILVQIPKTQHPLAPKEMKFDEDPFGGICVVSCGQTDQREVFALLKTASQKGIEE